MGKYQPTEEQREAAKLRREKFRELVKHLGEMTEGERLAFAARLPLIATCEGHALSGKNQMLVALQCPTVTIVGGFRQWKKQGRAVRKGEHGLMIFVPSEYGRASDDTPQPSEIDGKSEDGAPRGGVRFLMGTVFDISQTEPTAIYPIAQKIRELEEMEAR